MNLIPKVKQLEIFDGFLTDKVICFDEKNVDGRLATALKKLPCDSAGARLDIRITGDQAGNGANVKDMISDVDETYELCISEDHIDICAAAPAGAFYAIQTLRQLFREEQVPCLCIKDKPDFSHRGFYHDVTRGRIQTVETIKKLIDDMAYYKLNSLQLYVEHVFEFEETKELWSSFGYLTKAEIREIDDYCRENFIDFIPSLSTFGHLYDLLEQPKYKHLQVLKEYETIPNFWHARMRHHTIDPLRSESIEVVKSLIDQ
ncbi:MAG: family 20 glycosylhydrolase [Lachnospiraceae bacterium]|nr:family 20 glycosylhydrolase [Lachnospiraceae bacterium]